MTRTSKEKGAAARLDDRSLSGEYLRMKETFSSLLRRAGPGRALDLLPDGRARQVVRRSALGHLDRAAVLDRHPAGACT